MKMTRKALALLLGCGMAFGSLSVYAATTTVGATTAVTGTGDTSIKVDSEMQTPTIKVVVPSSATLILNPYKVADKDQVISPVIEIKNESDVPMKCQLTKWDTTTTTTGVTFVATEALTKTSTKKDVFLYLAKEGEAFDVKNVARVVKSGAILPTVVGSQIETLDKKDGAKSTVKLEFKGAASSNVEWLAADKIVATPSFKFIPAPIVTP